MRRLVFIVAILATACTPQEVKLTTDVVGCSIILFPGVAAAVATDGTSLQQAVGSVAAVGSVSTVVPCENISIDAVASAAAAAAAAATKK